MSVSLACIECKRVNYRKHKTGTERLRLQKYCSNCARQVLHKEER